MTFPSAGFDAAVAAACHGTIADETLAELIALIGSNEAACDEYLLRTAIHARLATIMPGLSPEPAATIPAGDSDAGHGLRRQDASAASIGSIWRALLLGLAMLTLLSVSAFVLGRGGAIKQGGEPPATVARFGAIESAKWVAADARHEEGDPIFAGQRLELSAGTARIDFTNGAAIVLVGPAIFDVRSALEAELMLGRVQVTASTPESKGFTIHTRTARFVDLGTVFTAETDPDGQCRVGVASGEVLVQVAGSLTISRLRQGELMTIEPGRPQVTVRIERGEETPEFRFASIEPPSAEDYADASQGRASVSLACGPLLIAKFDSAFSSGGVNRLADGRAQGSADAPLESVFFHDGGSGGFLFDLGQLVTISKINSYSWHKSRFRQENQVRATQKYTVWGFAGDDPPAAGPPCAGNGWERIARIDTDDFFDVVTPLDRPAQQACSITSETRSLGRYRFLLFEVHPTVAQHDQEMDHTFYGEIDVYAEP